MAPHASSWRNVSERDKVILWARAAGRCAHPDRKLALIAPATKWDAPATFGQAAHIVAHSAGGPRSDPAYDPKKLDTYDNLVLLCGNHHTIVDKQPSTYTTGDLRQWKTDHETWITTRTAPTPYQPIGYHVILQEDQQRINANDTLAALAPDQSIGTPLHLQNDPTDWEAAAAAQEKDVQAFLHATPAQERRYAIFSLTPIPLAVHLGFIITDRAPVRLHQYFRLRNSWTWPATPTTNSLQPTTIDDRHPGTSGPAVIRVSLSATVTDDIARATVPNAVMDVHLTADRPDIHWLQHPDQLTMLATAYDHALTTSRARGRCTSIHLLYAGPTSGALLFGRHYNPRMNPALHLYQYVQQATPPYDNILTLNR